MTALEMIRAWLPTFPQFAQLDDFSVDYAAATPSSGGLMPGGLVEVSRSSDIVGNVTVTNQYNFTLYFTFAKADGDDVGATKNAEWLLFFQNWVQAQSVAGLAPAFGDDPHNEKIQAQNGTLYGTDAEGTALYSVQLSVQFIKKFKEDNPWLT